jgi:hypothetical protein
MSHRWTKYAAAAVSLLALAGCDQIDPLKRPYMWEESGVNDHNIAVMAANPSDLSRGRETPKRNVSLESDSIEKLWAGKPTPFAGGGASGSSSSGASGSSSATPGGS